MKKLAICIPTYQNDEYIEDRIKEGISFYREKGIYLYIVDSSINNNTEELVKRYQVKYENLLYLRFPSDVHSNEKVYRIYQKAGKEIPCDYIWVRSDALWCHEFLLKAILTYLEDDYDFILTTPQGYIKKEGIYSTNNIQALFEERAWQTCLYGAMIVNVKSVLCGVDWKYMKVRYLRQERINFSHVCLYFERLKQLDNPRVLVMDLPQLLYSGRKKVFSTWHKEIFELWLKRWPNAIVSLPDYYINKLIAIRNFGINENYYKTSFLRILKKQRILTTEVYKKYEEDIKKYSGVGEEVFCEVLDERMYPSTNEDYNTEEYRQLKKFIDQHDEVVIYGCGKRARRYADYLNENKKMFSFFLVSSRSEAEEYPSFMEHRVIIIDDFDVKKNVGIIMGLNNQHQMEVFSTIREKGIDMDKNVFAYPVAFSYIEKIWVILKNRIEAYNEFK